MILMTRRVAATLGLALLVLAAAGLAGSASLRAQGMGLGLNPSNSDVPIEVYADDGIEWQREGRKAIARGNARAVQGDVTVRADRLILHYRPGPTGGNEVWRIEAEGAVRVTSPDQTATGDYGVYEMDQKVLVLTGSPKLVTPTDEITARKQIEFWTERNVAVARDDARVKSEGRHLRANTLVAYFEKTATGKNEISHVDASGGVHISTPTEIARAESGAYNAKTGIATLSGSVKITRCEDQLNGEYAEVNLNTGISRLLGAPPQSGTKAQVRGIFKPRSVKPPTGTGN
ncbi:MAG: LptA/OstA family protein [Alphaproteobacteria bacterium]